MARPSRKEQPIRAILVVLAALCCVAAFTPALAQAKPGCHSSSCVERVARKQCSQTRVVPCIRRAAIHWRVSFPMLLRKARCESSLNPYAVGFAVHHGLFQFLPSTWRSTPYGSRWIHSAKWNSLAAAWMHRVGRGGEWACR